MKATGIVRRMDELGRIVLPIELRRTLKISVGDSLEIVSTEGGILLKKYSTLSAIPEQMGEAVKFLSDTLGVGVVMCDNTKVISMSGLPKKDYEGKALSTDFAELIVDRRSMLIEYGSPNILAEDRTKYHSMAITPIVVDGELLGAIAAFTKPGDRALTDEDFRIVETCVGFAKNLI